MSEPFIERHTTSTELAHVRAEAQNLKNSAEYSKIDYAKKKMAAASSFGGHGGKRRNSGRKKQFLT